MYYIHFFQLSYRFHAPDLPHNALTAHVIARCVWIEACGTGAHVMGVRNTLQEEAGDITEYSNTQVLQVLRSQKVIAVCILNAHLSS